MAYSFVPCDRDQPFLMPPSLLDWLPEDHLVWTILRVGGVTGSRVGGVIGDDSSRGRITGATSAGASDLFVRKYSPTGGKVWTQQMGGSDYDYGLGVAVHGSTVFVAGNTFGTLPGQTANGRYEQKLWMRDLVMGVAYPPVDL